MINARLRAVKASGGVVEILVERLLSQYPGVDAAARQSRPKPGTRLSITGPGGRSRREVSGRDDRFFLVQLVDAGADFESLMRRRATTAAALHAARGGCR